MQKPALVARAAKAGAPEADSFQIKQSPFLYRNGDCFCSTPYAPPGSPPAGRRLPRLLNHKLPKSRR